ncbi:MAG: hypothetical protein WCI17_06880 [bacterium]
MTTKRMLMMGTLGASLALAVPARAQQAQFAQASDPAGIFSSQATYHALGSGVATVNAPLQSGAYRFTHWTLNGARTNDLLGCAVNPARFVISAAVAAVAHYTNSTADADTDGVPDWYELYYTGALTNSGASDHDGDGFTLADEYRFDYHPLIQDRIAAGGYSRQQSALTTVQLDARAYSLTSDPPGLLSQSGFAATGAVVRTPDLHGDGNTNNVFAYWTVDGVRQADATGRALSRLALVVTNDVAAVAHYIDQTLDSDADSLPDWWEWIYYDGIATCDGTADPDGDGFVLADEYRLDNEPLIPDRIVAGGISRQQSAQITIRVNAAQYTFTSDPPGLLDQSGLVATGAVLRTPDLHGAGNTNHVFAYWTVNGVRQADATGQSLSQLAVVITNDVTAVAHYLDRTLDSDTDGLPDWWEWIYYDGSAIYDGTGDPDGDGFVLADEYRLDYEPLIPDRIVAGGVSRRQTASMFYVRPTPQLTVLADHGEAAPAPGVYLYDWAAGVTCTIAGSLIEAGATQFVFQGWSGSGSAPAGGATHTVSFLMTNHTTLTWVWRTNVQFICSYGRNGSLSGDASGWYELGSTALVTALPAAYYHLSGWTGDVPPGQTNSNPLPLCLDQARTITAGFAANLAAYGTPHWWLAQYGLSTNDVGALHEDGDGAAAWEEYVADTDPTNPASRFAIAAISNLPLAQVSFTSSPQRFYQLQWRESLTAGAWTNVNEQGPRIGAGGLDSLQDTTARSQSIYRVEARLSP